MAHGCARQGPTFAHGYNHVSGQECTAPRGRRRGDEGARGGHKGPGGTGIEEGTGVTWGGSLTWSHGLGRHEPGRRHHRRRSGRHGVSAAVLHGRRLGRGPFALRGRRVGLGRRRGLGNVVWWVFWWGSEGLVLSGVLQSKSGCGDDSRRLPRPPPHNNAPRPAPTPQSHKNWTGTTPAVALTRGRICKGQSGTRSGRFLTTLGGGGGGEGTHPPQTHRPTNGGAVGHPPHPPSPP